ncbi:hypothetical protein FB451DRAFT_1181330 [Mycena latifolia]|nr:hypothetical protein FB451DRAFT_1181330 [Mycena latifolia]
MSSVERMGTMTEALCPQFAITSRRTSSLRGLQLGLGGRGISIAVRTLLSFFTPAGAALGVMHSAALALIWARGCEQRRREVASGRKMASHEDSRSNNNNYIRVPGCLLAGWLAGVRGRSQWARSRQRG